jgi:hypothetical protein
MDIGTAFIGAVALAICILPFFWLRSIRKKAETKMLAALTDFAAEHNGSISRHEIFRDLVIGFDEGSNSLFFYKKSDTEELKQHVQLANVKTCKVVKTSQTLQSKDGARTMIERLELAFVPVAEKEPTIALEFYDMHKNVQLNGELQLIEKWDAWLNERLKQAK